MQELVLLIGKALLLLLISPLINGLSKSEGNAATRIGPPI
jgi:formate hydrogenlyase subunit 4